MIEANSSRQQHERIKKLLHLKDNKVLDEQIIALMEEKERLIQELKAKR